MSASRYQNRSSMHIRGLIPRNSMELAEAVPIEGSCELQTKAPRDQENIFQSIIILARPDDTSSRSLAFRPLHHG